MRFNLTRVAVGFPANMSPYTGMNAAGIAVASNEVSSPLDSELAIEDRSSSPGVVLRETRCAGKTLAHLASFSSSFASRGWRVLMVYLGSFLGSAVKVIFSLLSFLRSKPMLTLSGT